MMLYSENINTAFFWRTVSALGYCFFDGYWLYITFLFNDTNKIKHVSLVKFLVYVPGAILFICNIIVEPSVAMTKVSYGWIDVAPNLFIQVTYGIWSTIIDIAGLIVLFLRVKYSKKNRVKKQNRIILITCLVSITLGTITDFVLPMMGIVIFPLGIVAGTIAFGGLWYAMNKHKMMLSTSRYISEYIFNTVNEPILILGEDFVVQNCNRALLNITEYELKEIEGKKFNKLIDYENVNFNTIIDNYYIKEVEVNLQKKDGSYTICELSSTVLYDEYNDKLGILILLHDISERKKYQK